MAHQFTGRIAEYVHDGVHALIAASVAFTAQGVVGLPKWWAVAAGLGIGILQQAYDWFKYPSPQGRLDSVKDVFTYGLIVLPVALWSTSPLASGLVLVALLSVIALFYRKLGIL